MTVEIETFSRRILKGLVLYYVFMQLLTSDYQSDKWLSKTNDYQSTWAK